MSAEDQSASQRSATGWYFEGARQAIFGPAWVVAFSLLGVGGLARAAGFPLGAAAASTMLIWAGPAQVIFFVAVAAKTAWSAVAISASLSSMRMFPMTIALLPLLRGKNTKLSTMVMAAWFMGITVWTESLRRTPVLAREVRVPFFFGFAMTCMGLSTLSTMLGYELVERLPLALAAGILFLSPLYFVTALLRNAHQLTDAIAICLGLVLAPVAASYIGGGFDLLVVGLCGGGIAYLSGRLLRRHRVEQQSDLA